MNEKVRLFKLNREDIQVTVDTFFKDDDLLVIGYDIGKTVEMIWGDSDYEYSITVEKKNN